MIGILLIYWVGKFFYDLAQTYTKSKWGYAILGLVVYFGSQLVLGFVLAIFNDLFALGIDFENNYGINLLGIPVGILACYILYHYLQKKWKKEYVNPLSEIDSIGVSNE